MGCAQTGHKMKGRWYTDPCNICFISLLKTQGNSKSVKQNMQCPAVLGLNCRLTMANAQYRRTMGCIIGNLHFELSVGSIISDILVMFGGAKRNSFPPSSQLLPGYDRRRITPAVPSTSTLWPSLSFVISPSMPTTQGFPYSRAITAPC